MFLVGVLGSRDLNFINMPISYKLVNSLSDEPSLLQKSQESGCNVEAEQAHLDGTGRNGNIKERVLS